MSNVDELLKYKELLDKDVITKEEFEVKKKELLKDNETTVNVVNKFCHFCGKKIPADSKVCIYCGKHLEHVNNVTNVPKKTGVSLGCLMPIVILFIVIIAIIIINGVNTITPKKLLTESYGLSTEEANNVIDIIDKCGYSEYYPTYKLIKGIDNEEIKGSQGFEIMSGDKTIGFVDIKDNKVCIVQYSDKYLYKDGKVQHTLSEYLMKSSEKEDYVFKTQETIKAILKSPSTAKFPWDYNEWSVVKENSSIIVQGYVDAQNSFGATTRSQFQVTYKNGNVISLIFDEKEYMK